MILSDADLAGGPPLRAKSTGVASDYDAIEAVNWSTLKHLAVSAKLLRYRVDHPRRDTEALARGRAIHCAIFEPDRFEAAYVKRPHFGDLRTKIAKTKRAEWLVTLSPDVEVLDPEEHELALRLAAAVHEHPAAAKLLRGGRAEEIITWTDEETGVRCKSRIDWITPFFILDLKSMRHETLRAMNTEIARLRYHGQLAMYHEGATAARLIHGDDLPRILIVQTTEPYDVVPMRLTQEDFEKGRGLFRQYLRRYVECQAAAWWPGLATDVIDSDLPAWAPGGEEPEPEDW